MVLRNPDKPPPDPPKPGDLTLEDALTLSQNVNKEIAIRRGSELGRMAADAYVAAARSFADRMLELRDNGARFAEPDHASVAEQIAMRVIDDYRWFTRPDNIIQRR